MKEYGKFFLNLLLFTLFFSATFGVIIYVLALHH